MKAITRIVDSTIVLLLITSTASAQFYKDMSVGINGGVFVYQGDLTPQRTGSWKTPSFGLSLFAKKPINHFLAARINMSFSRLKADESRYSSPDWRKQRNFMSSSPLTEFTGQLVWNIRGRNYDDRGIMPYVFAGAGVSFIRVRPDFSRMNTTIFSDGSDVATGIIADMAHGTPRAIAVVPVGIGAEYPISSRFSLNIETAYRFTFTDYLDGFSQAANPKKDDRYHSTSLGLVYKFGNKANANGTGCPTIKY
jgi:Outer membrane protein beta-barrel domain